MIVLDTNVISETMRLKPLPIIMRWIEENDPLIWLPTVALAEVAFGIQKVPASQQSPRWSRRLLEWRTRYHQRILSFDAEAADQYGILMGYGHLNGRPVAPLDGMIAAIALRHGASLATRNTSHFRIAGLKVIDPWAATA